VSEPAVVALPVTLRQSPELLTIVPLAGVAAGLTAAGVGGLGQPTAAALRGRDGGGAIAGAVPTIPKTPTPAITATAAMTAARCAAASLAPHGVVHVLGV
jgi:hypothetical protein